MAHTEEMLINGVMTPVVKFDHSAQQIDDAVDKIPTEGAAPAGFGLGMGSEFDVPKVTNIKDSTLKNGWYRAAASENAPVEDGTAQNYGWFHVSRASFIRVDYYTAASNPVHYVCYCVNGTWSEWDCVNPPMLHGVEYRTTERYLGKPVYVKAVRHTMTADTGNASGSTNFAINGGVSSVDSAFVDLAVYVNGNGDKYQIPAMDANGNTFVSINRITSGNLYTVLIVNTAVIKANEYFDVVYKYTKTTD